MKLIDTLLIFIAIVGVVLLTFTYLHASPPALTVLSSEGTVEIVGVSGNKCTINITGEIKNEGDVNALKTKVACNVMTGDNKPLGIGAANVGEIAPHKIKEFDMSAYLFECPTSTGFNIDCKIPTCENCPG